MVQPGEGVPSIQERATRGWIQALPSCAQHQDQRAWAHTGTQESPSEDQEALLLYEAAQGSGDDLDNQLWMVLLVHGGVVLDYLKGSFPNSTIQ